jgi:hypothetical protein
MKETHQRAAWAELYFTVLAMSPESLVSTPYGALLPFDVGVENCAGSTLWEPVKTCQDRYGTADTLHNLLGYGLLKMDGLAILFPNRVLRRFHGWFESKYVLVKQDGFLHVGSQQHGADSLRNRCSCHRGTSESRAVSSVETQQQNQWELTISN